jgi:glycosyltransferase involved in cell wall biosynthesis
MISKGEQEVRILLFGFINMNLMDGSAVFLSGFTAMLAQQPNLKIDLVLACPRKRDILLEPLLDLPNVNIISPYEDLDLISSKPAWVKRERMTFDEASYVIEHYWEKNNYDWFFIRGLEIAEVLLSSYTSILEKTFVYATGITHQDQELPREQQEKLESVFKAAAYLVCQTEEMKQYLLKKFHNVINNQKVITLNPMIPDTQEDFEKVFTKKDSYTKLCYTGKFAFGWNSIPMIVAFRELQEEFPELTFDIAGDKFNIHKDIPHYTQDLKYLLENTTNLKWYGALTRDESRDLIIDSDIGITWRDKSMDSSLELSTKLLEYGSLGKAVILNPTPMHRKIFGDDYPLYAETFDDFIDVIKKIQTVPGLYEKAARNMFEKSKRFTYSQTLKKIAPFFTPNNGKIVTFFEDQGFITPDQLLIQSFNSSEGSTIYELKLKNKASINAKQYIACSSRISNISSVQDIISEVSKLGEIENVYLHGKTAILIASKTKNGFLKNFYYNSNSTIYLELLDIIINDKVNKLMKTHA